MKIQYGLGVSDARGSAGGVVASRNRFGPYFRARVTPVNPQSPGQAAVRQAMADLSATWEVTLTAAQRAAWDLYGSSVAMLDSLGSTIYLTGQNHFIRSNLEYERQFGIATAPGPVLFTLPPLDATFAITASEATQQISITFNAALPWDSEDGAALFIYQGRPQNAQRNFFNGPWRHIGQILGSVGAPPPSPQVLGVDFAIAEGQRQWCYARIRRADGRISLPMRADTFCAA